MSENMVDFRTSAYPELRFERLAKAKIILPSDNLFVADEPDSYYGVPWIS